MTWLKACGIALLAVLSPIQAVLFSVMALVALDTFLGLLAAHKRSERIDSKGMRRTVVKIAVYQAAVIGAHLIQTYLTGDLIPAVKLVGSAIGLVEMKSLLENADEINGAPVFQGLIQRLQSKSRKPYRRKRRPRRKGAK